MKKIFYSILIPVSAVLILLSSCDSNDNNSYEVSEEWKALQAQVYKDISDNDDYAKLPSLGVKGDVYYKSTDSIIVSLKSLQVPETRQTEDGYPFFNDTVVCRYTGWYYLSDGTKFVFDTTEKANGVHRDFTTVVGGSVIDGWTTMLQYMKVGEIVEMCIPYTLGYGTYGSGQSIPGYTTLFFRMKLVEIKPVNKEEVDEWNKAKN